MHSRVDAYRKEVVAAMRAAGVDVIVCPGFGVPAVLHDSAKDLTQAAFYTLFANVTHLPAGVVPVISQIYLWRTEMVFDGDAGDASRGERAGLPRS